MGIKAKGSNAERQLVHMFWETGMWAAHRIAGSGSSKYPSPDIIASNNLRKIAIEAKTAKNPPIYIPISEILALKKFATMFGAEPWVAVKFNRKEWFFLTLEDLKITTNNYSISLELAQMKGLLFEEFVK